MDLYSETAYEVSRLITEKYSTSFSSSTKRFSRPIRRHIYAIYGLVRIADEIVDTYRGIDAVALLDDLETEVYETLSRGYSNNPVVHAFALSANQFGITKELIEPFFTSMRLDTTPQHFDQALYETYIYGSAEVVGLMCLKVFVSGDPSYYDKLESGAKSLGAAYQKINFLRDMAADYTELGRIYFPNMTYDTFDESAKQAVIDDIANDIQRAQIAVPNLPKNAKAAVSLSLSYYKTLLDKLAKTPVDTIKQKRVRVSRHQKLKLLIHTLLRERVFRVS